jgi:hypothetical protein
MKQLYPLLTILFLTVATHLFGQDTTIYEQANASMFSNNYTFIKKTKSDTFGTFMQYSRTDDMQNWYGHGVFTESHKKYFLIFDTTNNHNRMETVLSTGHSDTLNIKWFDWSGEQQEWFSIQLADTTRNNIRYQANFLNGSVKIPKKQVVDKHLTLIALGSNRRIFEFWVTEKIDEIYIFANDPVLMHTFTKTQETLKKNEMGFTTIGMWTKGKTVQFIKRPK